MHAAGKADICLDPACRLASSRIEVSVSDKPADLGPEGPPFSGPPALAVEPDRDETDLVERHAFQATAFITQYAVRRFRLKPNDVVPGGGRVLPRPRPRERACLLGHPVSSMC